MLFELKKSNTTCAFPQAFKKTVTSLNKLTSLVLNLKILEIHEFVTEGIYPFFPK